MSVDVRFLAPMKMVLDFLSRQEPILNASATWQYQHFPRKCPILVMVKVFSKKTLLPSKIVGFFNLLLSWESNFWLLNGLKGATKLRNCHHVQTSELIKAALVTKAMRLQNIQGKSRYFLKKIVK